ncbi:TRAM domain-containing protein [bacterium]|nr:TRAM domain-containing protein [candidate division CSSED10-310 bacterium]
MAASVFRLLVFLVSSASGYILVRRGCHGDWSMSLLAALVCGILMILAAWLLERFIRPLPVGLVAGALAGLAIGTGFGELLARVVILHLLDGIPATALRVLLVAFLGYLGGAYGAARGRSFDIVNVRNMLLGSQEHADYKILDTSVIIDGRVADICKTGFLEGRLVIPKFVLNELQYIADSSETHKRNRGRRGLDILNIIQKNLETVVEIVDDPVPHIKEVDSKLVEMAKRTGGIIVTNDFNLNKIAELQGVRVLNVNELANAVKPVVLPGETMRVHVLKEGKEIGQGVAYLDDGTMVVVDNAKKVIGEDIDVVVTSVLQTTAGRMIFGKPKDEASGF